MTDEQIKDLKRAAKALRTSRGLFPTDEHFRLAAAIESLAEQKAESAPLHPDDEAVDRFAEAMKAKLTKARASGRSGWQDPAWSVDAIGAALRKHVEKGDPRDVANYCMFLWMRGESIAPEPAQSVAVSVLQEPKQ